MAPRTEMIKQCFASLTTGSTPDGQGRELSVFLSGPNLMHRLQTPHSRLLGDLAPGDIWLLSTALIILSLFCPLQYFSKLKKKKKEPKTNKQTKTTTHVWTSLFMYFLAYVSFSKDCSASPEHPVMHSFSSSFISITIELNCNLKSRLVPYFSLPLGIPTPPHLKLFALVTTTFNSELFLLLSLSQVLFYLYTVLLW